MGACVSQTKQEPSFFHPNCLHEVGIFVGSAVKKVSKRWLSLLYLGCKTGVEEGGGKDE